MGRPGEVSEKRGGGWVFAQFALMALTVVAAVLGPRWPDAARPALGAAGVVLAIAGGVVAVWSARTLGRSLTPFPRPVAAGALVDRGAYAVVRHPIYSAGLLLFGGLALWTGAGALLLTGALAVLWALKAGVEERHLVATYPDYAAYRERVRYRLVPFVY